MLQQQSPAPIQNHMGICLPTRPAPVNKNPSPLKAVKATSNPRNSRIQTVTQSCSINSHRARIFNRQQKTILLKMSIKLVCQIQGWRWCQQPKASKCWRIRRPRRSLAQTELLIAEQDQAIFHNQQKVEVAKPTSSIWSYLVLDHRCEQAQKYQKHKPRRT